MAFAQGSRSGLSYIKETSFGVTPAGNLKEIPFTTQSLNLSKDRVQGNDIQKDRMPRHDRHGNRNAGGEVVFDLRADVYDDFLAGAMFNTWVDDQLKVGTNIQSFTFQDNAEDIGVVKTYTGLSVSEMSFSIQPNQMITTTTAFIGKDMATDVPVRTADAPALVSPFDAYSGALEIATTGGVLTEIANITSIDFSINNGLNPTFVVGSASTPQLEYGRAVIEGTINAHFDSLSLVNRFLDETETAVSVSLNDPTGLNQYTFFFPRTKFNDGATPVENPQSRMVTIPFVSLYDSTFGSNLVITRPDTV